MADRQKQAAEWTLVYAQNPVFTTEEAVRAFIAGIDPDTEVTALPIFNQAVFTSPNPTRTYKPSALPWNVLPAARSAFAAGRLQAMAVTMQWFRMTALSSDSMGNSLIATGNMLRSARFRNIGPFYDDFYKPQVAASNVSCTAYEQELSRSSLRRRIATPL